MDRREFLNTSIMATLAAKVLGDATFLREAAAAPPPSRRRQRRAARRRNPRRRRAS